MVKTWDDMVYMQDMTSDICASVQINSSKKLIDSRNGKTYIVTKLNDKNCWMTQNLEIINKTISSADSDMISGSFTIPASDKSGFTSSDQYQPKAYYEAPYGGYYNWFTATAGAGTSSVTSGDVKNSSICPKNWQLPPNSGDKSYSSLFTSYGAHANNTLQYGGQSIINDPLDFVYGGNVVDNTLGSAGRSGYYWTSTADSIPNAYRLGFSTDVATHLSSVRYSGMSVRCVAR